MDTDTVINEPIPEPIPAEETITIPPSPPAEPIPPPIEETPPTDVPVNKPIELNINKYIDEYATTNQLSDQSYTELENNGLHRQYVDDYLKGQEARMTLMQNEVKGTIGDDNYKSMIEWASTNISKEDQQAYNNLVATDNTAQAKLAVQGLYQRYTSDANTNTTNNQLIKGSTSSTNSGVSPYQSSAEMMKDMKTVEYRTDEAFRNKVRAKLVNANF